MVATPGRRPVLVDEIVAYFLRNPQCIDSLEGMTHWRLQGERIRREVEDVGEALEWLVERGFLQKVRSQLTEPLYRSNFQSLTTENRDGKKSH